MQLGLWELESPMPGLTAFHGGSLAEAAAVCLESQRHPIGVRLSLHLAEETATLHWRPVSSIAVRSHTGDRATEDGACGVAILLARAITGQVVLWRSERKEGCDYWLGRSDYPRHNGLKGMSRIEVSGIRRGDASSFMSRLSEKRKQIARLEHPSDKYVSIVEFGAPMATLEKL